MSLFRNEGAVTALLEELNAYDPKSADGDVTFVASTGSHGGSRVSIYQAVEAHQVRKKGYDDELVGEVIIPALGAPAMVDVAPGPAVGHAEDVLAEVAHRAAEALALDREGLARAA